MRTRRAGRALLSARAPEKWRGRDVALDWVEGKNAMDFDLSTTSQHHTYNLLIGLVAPRPIAWITSVDREGRLNAAPFSAYNYVATDPPIVAIGVGNRPSRDIVGKDTAHNIRNTREFVVNVVNEDLAEAMNICAVDFPAGVNELEVAGLSTEPSLIVKVPRISRAPAALECREITTMEIGRSRIILGQVVAMHVKDEFVDPSGPYIRAEAMHAVGRNERQGRLREDPRRIFPHRAADLRGLAEDPRGARVGAAFRLPAKILAIGRIRTAGMTAGRRRGDGSRARRRISSRGIRGSFAGSGDRGRRGILARALAARSRAGRNPRGGAGSAGAGGRASRAAAARRHGVTPGRLSEACDGSQRHGQRQNDRDLLRMS